MRDLKNPDRPINPVKFTFEWGDGRTEERTSIGLTKREYLAAMAMQGLLSTDQNYFRGIENKENQLKVAMASVEIADELLKQLEK